MTVSRFDTYQIKDKVVKLDTGFLKVPVFATRTGVFSYRKPDGSVRRELRHPDEVFNTDSLGTLSGVPLTNRHPSELVNSKNVKKYLVGNVGDIVERFDEGNVAYVKTSVTIMDEKAINEVEVKGLREVSCGYKCDVIDEPGEYNGERYDAVQRNIRYNHLAIVEKGRAGPNARLRMDADDAELVADDKSQSHVNNINGGRKMLVKIDGVEFEADNSLASAITQALEKRDNALVEAKKSVENLKTDSQKELDTVQAKYDQLKEDHDKLKERHDSMDVKELVKARVALVEACKPHLDKETCEKIDEMSDNELKVAVIKSKSSKFDAEGKSDEYINARFDGIMESDVAPEPKKPTKLDGALSKVEESRKDGEEKSADEIRRDNMKRDSDLWNLPLSEAKKLVGGN